MNLFKRKKEEVNTIPIDSGSILVTEVFIESGNNQFIIEDKLNTLINTTDIIEKLNSDVFTFRIVTSAGESDFAEYCNSAYDVSKYLNGKKVYHHMDKNTIEVFIVDSLTSILKYLDRYYIKNERGSNNIIDSLACTCYTLRDDLEYLKDEDNKDSVKYTSIEERLYSLYSGTVESTRTDTRNGLITLYKDKQKELNSRIVFFVSDSEMNASINSAILKNAILNDMIEDKIYSIKYEEYYFYHLSCESFIILYNEVSKKDGLDSIIKSSEELERLISFYKDDYININNNLYDSIDEVL